MDDRRELTLTLHGLEEYNHEVDGEVFARKLTAFLKGIRLSDKAVNGRRRHKLLLTDLRKNTATASVREQVYVLGPSPGSGMEFFEDAVQAVFDNRPSARQLPLPVVREIAAMNHGSGHSFAFAELKSTTGNVIRLDEALAKRARSLVLEMEARREGRDVRFTGVAYGSFDGKLEEVDLRGDLWKGILVLSAGGKQIECTVSALEMPDIRLALKRRVVAYGRAHYGGASGLPERLEIISVKPVKSQGEGNLARWRGAFDIPEPDPAEDWN
ncbi:hypothetical protein [Acidisphaera sp. S103]|uniref:hypothetical protein n=1 Tax=Acidisphaera sp. S103 TaxID=1747223 RepID=UPI00131AC4F7|nr:hypothetical protein [Acidisphaera sp. S103]